MEPSTSQEVRRNEKSDRPRVSSMVRIANQLNDISSASREWKRHVNDDHPTNQPEENCYKCERLDFNYYHRLALSQHELVLAEFLEHEKRFRRFGIDTELLYIPITGGLTVADWKANHSIFPHREATEAFQDLESQLQTEINSAITRRQRRFASTNVTSSQCQQEHWVHPNF